MPLRDSIDLQPIARVFREILALDRLASDPATRQFSDELLRTACRQLERFIAPCVSVDAAERARQLGLGTLSAFAYAHQVGRMSDRGRKIFHWEHVLPVSEMKRRLRALGRLPTLKDIIRVIKTADVAWILKTEDAALRAAGFQAKRRDPWQAYSDVGIRILDPATRRKRRDNRSVPRR